MKVNESIDASDFAVPNDPTYEVIFGDPTNSTKGNRMSVDEALQYFWNCSTWSLTA